MTSSKPFLVLQMRPEDPAADNEFDAILHYGGLSASDVDRLRVHDSGIPPLDASRYRAIIAGGSPYDISAPEASKSDAQKRVESSFRDLFDQVVPADIPFLGACSGNGLLGSYLGAGISREFSEPVSAATLELTAAGAEDPILQGFPSRFRVLLGHKEACDHVPRGAALLVRGEACEVQMFRIGQNVYATQFHPEGDPRGFEVRVNVYRNYGYFPPEEADALIERLRDEHTPWAQEILRRFVDRYRGGGNPAPGVQS